MKLKKIDRYIVLGMLLSASSAYAYEWDECHWPGNTYHCSQGCTSAPQCTPTGQTCNIQSSDVKGDTVELLQMTDVSMSTCK